MSFLLIYFMDKQQLLTEIESNSSLISEQELLAANTLNEEIFATPAIADGRLYVRTVSALYCFGTR